MNVGLDIWKGGRMVFFSAIAFLCFSCSGNKDASRTVSENTQVTGEITIMADQAFKPLLKTSVETFEAIYDHSKINVIYQAQQNAIHDLLERKTDVVISARVLTKAEADKITEKGLYLKENKIGTDALVFILNKKNKDSILTMAQITAMLGSETGYKLVCDQSNSAGIIYLKEKIKDLNTHHVFAAGSDSAVIEYIKNNDRAVGMIGFNTISDYDDHKTWKNISDLKILSVQYKDSSGALKTAYPSQEEIYTGAYPFCRNIYIINTDAKLGLGTGFAAFLLSERGQRIVLKSGLLPARMPGREIIIN